MAAIVEQTSIEVKLLIQVEGGGEPSTIDVGAVPFATASLVGGKDGSRLVVKRDPSFNLGVASLLREAADSIEATPL